MKAAALLLLAASAWATDVRAVRGNIDMQKAATRAAAAALAEVGALRQRYAQTADLEALVQERSKVRAGAEAALARLEAANKAAHDDIIAYGQDQGQRLYAGFLRGDARELSSLVTGRETDRWARKVAWMLTEELRAEEHDFLTGREDRASRRARTRFIIASASAALALAALAFPWRRRLLAYLMRPEVDVIDLTKNQP